MSLQEVRDQCSKLLTQNHKLQKELKELRKVKDCSNGDPQTELQHAKEALLGMECE
jgi:chaperonin cofactor prefoldin